ncbi:periplasmic divalent cation tolerance protein CutA [Dehalogenimonas sp. WBC-2]|nr:periplasmic divalent cation tolerance protein CutA [Dehalogenimonas sp. WBC-2]
MNNFNHILVMITAADNEEARLIAKVLLEQRKAGCVSIMDGINSAYWWKGEIENSTESLLVAKTSAGLLNDLITTVKEIHSYETPEIVALPIIGGNADYLEWLDESLETEGSENTTS